MLEFLVIPIQITVLILTVLTVAAVAGLTVKRKWKFASALTLSIVISAVAFIPLCAIVLRLVHSVRYGRFEYAEATSISDRHVEIPPSATNIEVYKSYTGHQARFMVTEEHLNSWLVKVISTYEGYWDGEPEMNYNLSELSQTEFDKRFGQFGWTYDPSIYELLGPHAPNGAGFLIWYSPAQQMAYMDAGYW
jgi:hypothetical protein